VATQSPDPASTAWRFAGDFRLRYEATTEQKPNAVPGVLDPRHRAVIRFRGRVAKRVSDQIDFGLGVATGARGDPNTTDVTLGDFVDKLEVSLDRAYLGWTYKKVALLSGKFANPLVRTELVWDDDVSPQGVAGSLTLPGSERFTPSFTVMYSIVDENISQPDSHMLGGQMQFRLRPAPVLSLTIAAGYYDYAIKSLAHADAGDIQSNHINASGTGFVSDFDLADAIVMMDYRGLGEHWPVTTTVDFVRNLGAVRIGEDEGFLSEVTIGRASAKHDIRYKYGFSRAETDAVLAAFSNDNLTFATNYVAHTAQIDYVASPNAMFTATLYVYRRDQLEIGPGTGPGQNKNFVSRLRLNALIRF
jgi:hypothetical protein